MDEITMQELATRISFTLFELTVAVPHSQLVPERPGLDLDLYAEAVDRPQTPVVVELDF
jgi:hypothetical protein